MVNVLAAYLLPPEIYDGGALYFCGGELRRDNLGGEPIAEIKLK